MVHFIPPYDMTIAVDIANLFLNYVWKLHSLTKKLVSDKGPQFAAKFTKAPYK